MAVSIQSQLAANLEDMVTCAICTDRLQAPKHLQCQHSFCTHCLQELMAAPANLNSNSLPCPTCRHLTDLPSKGVDALPADFNKNILMDLLSLPAEVAPPVVCTPVLSWGSFYTFALHLRQAFVLFFGLLWCLSGGPFIILSTVAILVKYS